MSTSYGPSTYRPMRPGPAREKQSPPPQHHEKRKITAVACLSCQKKRCKCDGMRPRCTACAAAGLAVDCTYETRGNQSRVDALKELNKDLQDENARLRRLLESAGTGADEPKDPSEVSSRRRVPARVPAYEVPPAFRDDVATNNVPQPHMLKDADRVLGFEARDTVLMGSSPSLGTFSSVMGQPADGARRALPPLIDPNETLQRKVARLETEVERLRAAVWQYPSYHNQPLQRSNVADTERHPSQHGFGTIDPSRITMETQNTRNHSSIPFDYPAPATPFSEYSVGVPARSSLPPVNVTTPFGLSNTEPSSQASSPPMGAKRRRSPERGRLVQKYVHKRRRYGSIVTLFGNLPFSSAILANHQPPRIQGAQIQGLDLPIYLLQILNSEDHSLAENDNVLSPEFASSTFHRFRTYGRRLIANNTHCDDVLGPNEIDVQQFFRNEQYILNNHTTSTFAPWFLRAYPSLSFPSKVACALLIQILLRWQICPNLENFEAIPEWLRATGCQMFIPHISAFDFIPWPEIRDLLIVEGKLPERQVLIMIISNLVIMWPRSTEDIFTWDYASGTATGVDPRFVDHVRNIENWAINDKVLEHYPFLEGKAHFADIHTELEQVASESERRHREDRKG